MLNGKRGRLVGGLVVYVQQSSVPLHPEEHELLRRGYVLSYTSGTKGAYYSSLTLRQYSRGADASEFLSFLPKEAVEMAHLYLSKFDPSPPGGEYFSFGSYRASLYLQTQGYSPGQLSQVSYSYLFSLVSTFGANYLHDSPAWLVFDVFGKMSGPYPEGSPDGFEFGSRIYVPVFSDRERRVGKEVGSRSRIRKLRPPDFVDSSSLSLLMLKVLNDLDGPKSVSEIFMSSEVFLTSGSPISSISGANPPGDDGVGDGDGGGDVKESGKPSTSYLYIGTVGDLLSGLLGEKEGEEEEEEEEGE